jgi:uroporphyrinogen decarboxylase
VIRGALETLDNVETFTLPDFDDPACYDHACAMFENASDRWHLGFIHGFSFSMARKLRRLDQYFVDLMMERDKIAVLHDRIDEQIKHQIHHMHAAGADSIFFTEDWGTQQQMFISPWLWRDEFKPRFADLCAYAHDLGLTVFMHSCGKITAIIPDLIEAGIDLFQFDQPTLHGLDALAAFQEQHAITYWCPVDIQTILPTRDEALIRQGVRAMLETLWRGRGGFIAGCYPTPDALGLDPQWQAIASDEFLRSGQRAQYIS